MPCPDAAIRVLFGALCGKLTAFRLSPPAGGAAKRRRMRSHPAKDALLHCAAGSSNLNPRRALPHFRMLSMVSMVPPPRSSGARNSPRSTSRRKASTTSVVSWVPETSRMMETALSKFMRLR